MLDKTQDKRAGRTIHVRLPLEIHKRLRIRTAELDMSIQEWVATVVTKELEPAETGQTREAIHR